MIPVIRGGQSFRGAGRYYLHDKRPDPDDDFAVRIGDRPKPQSKDRVAWVETRNCVNDEPQAALDEMWCTHSDAAVLKKAAGIRAGGRAPTKPVKTIALSWHIDERPDRVAMRAAADDYLAAMGWSEHQAIIVCHTDTRHPHLHIILNRVHPVTGRTLDDSNDRPRAQAWALGYELTHGRVFCTARELKAAEAHRRIEAARDARNRELVQPVTDLALSLASRHLHAVSTPVTGRELSAEQRQAAEHLLQGADLAAVTGYAGTGKTRLLERTRRAWEAQGLNVRGATLSGIAARNLEQGSGIQSRTIASLEFAWSRGREKLSGRDVLVVDEAGMVSAPQMQRLLSAVRDAGAKIVLVGDPEQLQPINSPAPYRAITQLLNAAELTEIRRQSLDWQRQSTKELATGQTRRALARYDGEGVVHAAKTPADARRALIDQWDQDRLKSPGQNRVILAHRRADAVKLNEMARDRMRETGALGRDTRVDTTTGERLFAVGDTVVFGRNDRDIGVNNGTRGVINSISEHRLSAVVIEDGRRRSVSIPLYEYKDIAHGYALTVHKAQGLTVDAAHVLASRQYDRHIAYVALSRHRADLHLHYAESEFQSLDRLSDCFARAPLPLLTRAQVQTDDIFCAERLKRDYAQDILDTPLQAIRTRGEGAGFTPADTQAIRASARRFDEAEAVLATHAAQTPRQERDAMADRHKAERDHFFAERGRFIKALRDEVYQRARESQSQNWKDHHAFAKESRSRARSHAEHFEAKARAAAAEGDLDAATAHLAERDAHIREPEFHIRRNAKAQDAHQRMIVKARQNEACAAFINERYSDYAALKDRQQDERHELKALQGRRDKGEWTDPKQLARLTRQFSAPPLDEAQAAAHITAILDRLDLVRETVPGAAPMANEYDPLREAEERALYTEKARQETDKQLKTFEGHAADADRSERGLGNDRPREERLKSYAQEINEEATQARREAEQRRETQGQNASQKPAAAQRQVKEQNAGQGDTDDSKRPDEAEVRARAQAEEQARAERQREAERMAREADAERQRVAQAEETAKLFAETAKTFMSAKDRWHEALGKHYDYLRPYDSLARAAGYEKELFIKERHEVAKKIDATKDPDLRKILILEDRAAIAEYQARLAYRNARISEVITGRFADPEALRDRMTAHERFYQGMRGEYAGEWGNTSAQRQDQIAIRQREIATELKAEIGDRRLAWERHHFGLDRAADLQRARSQEAETLKTSQSTSQSSATIPSWILDKTRELERQQERERTFRTASKEATRTQDTQADRTETRERAEREAQTRGHGQRRGR